MYRNRAEKYVARFGIAFIIIGSLFLAFRTGYEHAINNMIVTNQKHEEGHYEVSLDGKTYYFWYEEERK